MIRVTSRNKDEAEGGRPGVSTEMTPQQIQYAATKVMENSMSKSAWRALDLLFAGGIMTVDQLGMTPRTMRRYAKKHIVKRYGVAPRFVIEKLGEYGLDVENGQLYTLGPVGIELTGMRHGVKPPTGYLSYSLERVLHDVIVNEIVLRIAQEAEAHGWEFIWASKYQATIFREDIPILEPDALIRLKRENVEAKVFLIEYHNEAQRTRALQKVRQYERAWESDLWQEPWEVESFPPLLAVFRKEIVGEGYLDGIKESAPVDVAYYGRALSSVLAEGGLADWFHINTKKKGNVFPWYLGE